MAQSLKSQPCRKQPCERTTTHKQTNKRNKQTSANWGKGKWWWQFLEREYIHYSMLIVYLSLMVRAGYVCVAIIHRTLKWTTESLSCAQMLMHAIAHGGVRTPIESLHWKLTPGRKSLAAPGNRTCISCVTVVCFNQPSDIPSPPKKSAWVACIGTNKATHVKS